MRPIRTYLLLLATLAVLAGCKHKKKPSLSGEDPVEVNDFIDFFPEVKLPFQFADTDLVKKDPDSLRISFKVFSEFVPDSSISRVFGKGVKPQFFPMGKVTASKEENIILKNSTNALQIELKQKSEDILVSNLIFNLYLY